MKPRRTIILLCAKRSGTTAIFRIFQNHPHVSVCHMDQSIHGCEASYWHFAARAISGERDEFVRRFSESHPFLGARTPTTCQQAFDLWDEILDRTGPMVFDKTPKTLGHQPTIDLINAYRALGNDVRLLAVVRDPRDVIASQYTLWAEHTPGDSPEHREQLWVCQYEHLELLRAREFIPLFRYEDLAAAPDVYVPQMLHHCGLDADPSTWRHIQPVNVGRHRRPATRPELGRWQPGLPMQTLMRRYGYETAAASRGVGIDHLACSI